MLSVQGLVPEDMGGNVQCVLISALKGTNVEDLVEAILLQAEISNLRSDPDGFVEGVVLESRVDPHLGYVFVENEIRGLHMLDSYLNFSSK